jgi:hypothetical protein
MGEKLKDEESSGLSHPSAVLGSSPILIMYNVTDRSSRQKDFSRAVLDPGFPDGSKTHCGY